MTSHVVVISYKIIRLLVLWTVSLLATPALASEVPVSYSKLSNKELRSRALTVVKGIRQLVYSYNEKDRDLTSDFETEYLATRTTERQLLQDQWRKKIDAVQEASLGNYLRNFASSAARLREELQRRLPKRLQSRDTPKLYSTPANVLSLEVVADELELLAKSLPET